MAKKFVPSIPVHKVKFMKRDNKKKLLFKRVLDFLKSDNYMFAPLVSSQSSSLFTTSTGVEENEPIEGKNKKFLGKMKDYMKSDCYMYAPLVMNQPWFRAATCPVNPRSGPVSFSESTADTSRQRDTTKIVAGETKDLGQNIKSISIGEQNVEGYPYTRSAVIRHTLLQRETVKHVIQQNVRVSSAQGDVKKEKKGGKGTKIKGRNSRNTKKKKGPLEANTRKLASE